MCRNCKKRTNELIQGLWKPWAAPVKLCEQCVQALKGRRWYGD
jgi:hypothetical protein